MINEADITRRFKNLISTAQLVKKIGQHGYQGEYTEQAIYKLLDKYGIKAKTTRGGKSYFNKKNACTCIDRHIFELREIAEQLAQQNQTQEEPEWNVGYGRDDMSVASREQLANDGVFGADENELYDDVNESIFSFKGIVNEAVGGMYDPRPFNEIGGVLLKRTKKDGPELEPNLEGMSASKYKQWMMKKYSHIAVKDGKIEYDEDGNPKREIDKEKIINYIKSQNLRMPNLHHVPTTYHAVEERQTRKEECAKLINFANNEGMYGLTESGVTYPGEPIFSIVVNRGHKNGPEIHTLTKNAFVYIQNLFTKELITFFVPTDAEVKRYWYRGGGDLRNGGSFNVNYILSLIKKYDVIINKEKLDVRGYD